MSNHSCILLLLSTGPHSALLFPWCHVFYLRGVLNVRQLCCVPGVKSFTCVVCSMYDSFVVFLVSSFTCVVCSMYDSFVVSLVSSLLPAWCAQCTTALLCPWCQVFYLHGVLNVRQLCCVPGVVLPAWCAQCMTALFCPWCHVFYLHGVLNVRQLCCFPGVTSFTCMVCSMYDSFVVSLVSCLLPSWCAQCTTALLCPWCHVFYLHGVLNVRQLCCFPGVTSFTCMVCSMYDSFVVSLVSRLLPAWCAQCTTALLFPWCHVFYLHGVLNVRQLCCFPGVTSFTCMVCSMYDSFVVSLVSRLLPARCAQCTTALLFPWCHVFYLHGVLNVRQLCCVPGVMSFTCTVCSMYDSFVVSLVSRLLPAWCAQCTTALLFPWCHVFYLHGVLNVRQLCCFPGVTSFTCMVCSMYDSFVVSLVSCLLPAWCAQCTTALLCSWCHVFYLHGVLNVRQLCCFPGVTSFTCMVCSMYDSFVVSLVSRLLLAWCAQCTTALLCPWCHVFYLHGVLNVRQLCCFPGVTSFTCTVCSMYDIFVVSLVSRLLPAWCAQCTTSLLFPWCHVFYLHGVLNVRQLCCVRGVTSITCMVCSMYGIFVVSLVSRLLPARCAQCTTALLFPWCHVFYLHGVLNVRQLCCVRGVTSSVSRIVFVVGDLIQLFWHS